MFASTELRAGPRNEWGPPRPLRDTAPRDRDKILNTAQGYAPYGAPSPTGGLGGPAPLDDGGWEAACVFGVAIQTPSTQVDDRTLHRRRAQQPQGRQAYADSMALAAAYGRPPEPRYEQPAPQYQDPGPYRAQEPLPSQLARPAKKKRPRRKHGELARGIVRRREDWDDHCLIEMDDGRVSASRQLQGAFNSQWCGALCGRCAANALPAAARWCWCELV